MAEAKPKQGLSSVGLDVIIGGTALNYIKDISDIGGKPDTLDVTCMKDTVTKSIPGVKSANEFTVNYLYEAADPKSDYRALRALEKAGAVVPVVVDMPDGASYSATGYVSTYINGVKMNDVVGATVTVNLQSDWIETFPEA